MQEQRVTGSSAHDGRYQYAGHIEEVKADVADKDAFVRAAADHAKEIIADNLVRNLTPTSLDVNEEGGTFKIQFKDKTFEARPTFSYSIDTVQRCLHMGLIDGRRALAMLHIEGEVYDPTQLARWITTLAQ